MVAYFIPTHTKCREYICQSPALHTVHFWMHTQRAMVKNILGRGWLMSGTRWVSLGPFRSRSDPSPALSHTMHSLLYERLIAILPKFTCDKSNQSLWALGLQFLPLKVLVLSTKETGIMFCAVGYVQLHWIEGVVCRRSMCTWKSQSGQLHTIPNQCKST